MCKLAALLSAGIGLLLASTGAKAETITQSYSGAISVDYGHPLLNVGDVVTVTYVLDTAAPDRDPDPKLGWYLDDAVISLRVQVPSAGLDVILGPGQLQTFDNTDNPDDQISVYAGRVIQPDTLGGSAVTAAELYFTGYPGPNGEPPSMITTDALPSQRVDADLYGLALHTQAEGWFNVDLAISNVAAPTVQELVDSATGQLRAAAQSGAITDGIARSLSVKLQSLGRSFAANNQAQACSMLGAFSHQLAALHGKRIPQALAGEMKAYATMLDTALDGCG